MTWKKSTTMNRSLRNPLSFHFRRLLLPRKSHYIGSLTYHIGHGADGVFLESAEILLTTPYLVTPEKFHCLWPTIALFGMRVMTTYSRASLEGSILREHWSQYPVMSKE